MIVDGRNSTKVAVCFVLLGVLMLVGVPLLFSYHREYAIKFWLGVSVATLLMLLFLGHSYNVGKRKLTAKERQNAFKVAAGAKYGLPAAVIAIVCFNIIPRHVFGWELSDDLAPILLGGFGALTLLMGIAVLLDNFWLKAIFMWNNSDPDIRKLWRGK